MVKRKDICDNMSIIHKNNIAHNAGYLKKEYIKIDLASSLLGNIAEYLRISIKRAANVLQLCI